jgi:hypothetical protein
MIRSTEAVEVKLVLRLVLALAVVLVLAGAAYASVHVGGWSFSANGQPARNFLYIGSCPVDLKFDWGVIGTRPGRVTYSFLRNDGGMSSPESVDLPAANHSVPVIDTWRLGANSPTFANYHGWVQLDIHSPNPVSKRINFTIRCR